MRKRERLEQLLWTVNDAYPSFVRGTCAVAVEYRVVDDIVKLLEGSNELTCREVNKAVNEIAGW